MKYKDIKDLSRKELVSKRNTMAEKIFGIKMKSHMKQAGNPLEVRILRRGIARINTALCGLNRKELKENSVGKEKN